ncbi:DUF1983 domain-containing protein [Escherichia coli]|nr:DUF1983 domain-containing protein [Escherichia coli]
MPIALVDSIVSSARSSSYDWNASKAALADSLNTVTTRTLDKIFEGNRAYRGQQERKQLLRSSAAPCTVVYGETRSSGLLSFVEQDSSKTLHTAIVLASHPLESVTDILIDGNPISKYGDLVSYEIHNDPKVADQYMRQHCPSWSVDMIGRGLCWIRVSFKFDPNKFPFGLPNVTVLKKGKKVYDPRTGKNVYSNNAALIILDYLRVYLKCPDSTINWESFKEAANICDEMVQNADGTSERRYTINGEFDMDEPPANIMTEMLKACGGDLCYVAGKYGLLVGAYYGPARYRLGEECVSGEVKIYPEASFDKRSNTITGRFISPAKGYSETDFPSVFVPEWVEKDKERKVVDIDYRFVTSPYQAQRISAIFLRRARAGRIIEVTCNMRGFKFKPGHYVTIDLPSIGVVGQEMRVLEWEFTKKGGVKVKLRQDAKEWNDATGQLPDSGDIDIPVSPSGVAQPQNFRYSVLQAGELTHGVLAWDNVGAYAYNIVQVKKNGEIVWTAQTVEQFVRVEGLTQGSYTATVVATSYKGGVSPEAYCEFNIQAPEPPASVEVKQGYFAITLIPHSRDLASVSTQYDFWTSGTTRLASTANNIVETQATRMGIGSTWTSEGLQNDKTYYWYIRTTNAFGSSAFVECAAHCYTSIEDLMPQIDAEFKKTETYKELTANLDNAVKEMDKNVGAVNDRVTSIFEELGDTIEGVVRETTEKFTGVNGEISALNSKLVAAQQSFDDKLAAESGRLGSLIETTNRSTVDLVNRKTQALSEQITATQGTLREELKNTESKLNSSIQETNKATTDLLNKTTEAIKQDLVAATGKITKLEDDVQKEVANLQASIQETNSTTVDLVNNTATAIRQELTSAKQEIVDEMGNIDELRATVSNTSKAVTTLEGKIDAQWGAKIQVDSHGNKYVAGIQLGMEGSGGQVQSYFMVSANNFAVYNPGNGTSTLVFAIKNNQAFLRDAFIENGTISSAKIAQEISSSNYDGNGYHKYGWYINKAGHAQFMDVWVKGNIHANSGNFTGSVNATSGTFRGDVYANNGSFRGNIDATGGTFRGRVEASVIRANSFEGAIAAHHTYGDVGPVYNSQQRVCRFKWRYVDNVNGQAKNVTFFFKLNGTKSNSQLNVWVGGRQILAGKKYGNDNDGMCAVGTTGLTANSIDIVVEVYTPWSTSNVTGITISCPTVIVSRSNSSFQGPWNESHD